MKTDDTMVYVAADPEQPGCAWAICVDRPEWKADTAKTLSDWIKDGASVQRVDLETGRSMLLNWKRPAEQGELL